MTSLSRYFHTLRYLRPVQIYGRAWRAAYDPAPPPAIVPARRAVSGTWTKGPARTPSLLSPTRWRFLNEEHEVASGADWDDPRREKLWLYNLHYFDDLNAAGAPAREAWHRALVARWIGENASRRGTGWEPYPTSLRIVNWIKWILAGNAPGEDMLTSLAAQAQHLRARLEIHLLGNHLFANAKALVCAGAFFEGNEAGTWLEKGLALLEAELEEQILSDGGHFELSPMYHALILEDVLDLLNITRVYGGTLAGRWGRLPDTLAQTAERMATWLKTMCHPDGEIAFFNDAAIGIAPSPAELLSYAQRLGVRTGDAVPAGLTALPASGYVRIDAQGAVLLLDVARIGPDYLPGHAHADTLTFELSLNGQRVVVNSGTSCYGVSAERLRQRSTAAHNTVVVDGADSSEVWGGFRVARRARPMELRIDGAADRYRVSCAHDGYRRFSGRPVHRREWALEAGRLRVGDSLTGRYGEAAAHLHFHPAVRIVQGPDGDVAWTNPGGSAGQVCVRGGTVTVHPSTYHPGFGVSHASTRLCSRFSAGECETILQWNVDA